MKGNLMSGLKPKLIVLLLYCLVSNSSAQLSSIQPFVPVEASEVAHVRLMDNLAMKAHYELRRLTKQAAIPLVLDADYRRALADLDAQNYALADEAFESYQQQHPGSAYVPFTSYHRAEIAFRKRDYETAAQRFALCIQKTTPEQIKSKDSSYAQLFHYAQFWRANSLARLGKYEEAALSYHACSSDSLKPFADDALFALGQIEESRTNYTQAIQFYQRIESKYPRSNVLVAAKLRHAQCLLHQRESSNAIAQLASAENTLHDLRQADTTGGTAYDQSAYFSEADIHFLRAEAENQLSQFSQAIDEYALVLSDSLSSSELRRQSLLGRGWAYLNIAKWDEALSSYDLVIDSSSSAESHAVAMARLYRCVALKKKGDRSEAARELSTLASSARYSQLALALLELGQMQYEDGKFEAARRSLERASHESPDLISSLRIQLLLGAVFVELQEWKKAIQCYQTAEIAARKTTTQSNPLRETYLAEAQFKHGVCAVEDYQYREAISYLNSFLGSNTEDPRVDEALFWLAEAFYRAELMKNAEESYQKLLLNHGASKRREEAYYGLGWTYFRIRDFDKANQTFSQMLKEFPQSRFAPDVYVRKGDALYLTKNYIEAAKAYKEAYKINPKEEQGQYAQFQIGQSLYRAKDYPNAVTQLRQFIKNFPKSVFADHAMYTVAYIATLLEHHDEAISAFESLKVAYPQSELVPASMYYIANSYYAKGEYETAISHYKMLMETYRSSYYGIEALRGLQESLSVLGRNDEAIEVGKSYMAANPDGAMREQINMKTIEIFLRKGDYGSAAKEYQEFLKKNPDSDYGAEAMYLLAKSQMGMNDVDAAQQSFSLLFLRYPKSDFAAQGMLQNALLHLNRSNVNAADSLFQLLSVTYPETELASRAYYERAQLLITKSDSTQALSLYKKSADMAQGEYSYQSLYRLAMLFRQREQNDSARAYFTRIGSYTDNVSLSAEAQYRIGELYLAEKNYQKAAETFESVKSHFDGVEDWYTLSLINLGECYEKLLNNAKAKEVYQTVIILHPADDYGKTAQSRLKRLK